MSLRKLSIRSALSRSVFSDVGYPLVVEVEINQHGIAEELAGAAFTPVESSNFAVPYSVAWESVLSLLESIKVVSFQKAPLGAQFECQLICQLLLLL